MCGRARCTLSREEVRAQANVESWNNEAAYEPSYNMSPSKSTPVLKQGTTDKERELHTMRWGLVPSYTKPGDRPDFFRMFNARSETVAEKGVFNKLLSRQRCIVFMNGFYEWKKEGTQKQPYFIYRDGQAALRMAALYDVWKGASDEPMYSYTILTTDSSERLTWLHDRMPVILRDEAAVDAWLSDTESSVSEGFRGLCMPYNEEDLQWFAVDPKMNSSRVDGPEVCQPLKRRPITSFFKAAGVKKEEPTHSVKSEASNPASKLQSIKEAAPNPAAKQSAELHIGHAPDGAELATNDIASIKSEDAESPVEVKSETKEDARQTKSAGTIKAEDHSQEQGSGQKKTKPSSPKSSTSDTSVVQKGLKRPADQHTTKRDVRQKTPGKGKITSFFTKNSA